MTNIRTTLMTLSLSLLSAGLAHAQGGSQPPPPPPAFAFSEIDPAQVESDTGIYYEGATSTPLGAIGVCESPFLGVDADAGYITDYISCPASFRNGNTEYYSNRTVGAQLQVEDVYTNPYTNGTQVWARYESDCTNPNGHWIYNRVYSC